MTKEYELLKKKVLSGTRRAIEKLIAEKEKAGKALIVSTEKKVEQIVKTTHK